jgi:hypothetical protein
MRTVEPLAKLPSGYGLCQGTTSEAAEKLGDSDENGEKHPSGAEAHVDSVGFLRGLKPPPPSASSFSAACSVVHQMANVDSGFSRRGIENN